MGLRKIGAAIGNFFYDVVTFEMGIGLSVALLMLLWTVLRHSWNFLTFLVRTG